MNLTQHRKEIKRWGFLHYLIAMIFNLLGRIGVHVWTVQRRTLNNEFVLPPELSQYTYKRMTRKEVLEFAKDRSLQMNANFVNAAFDRGDWCVGVLDDQKLSNYTWRSFTEAPVGDGIWISFLYPGQVYGYKAFCRPQYRGKRLATALSCYMEANLMEHGFSVFIGYIALCNLRSLQMSARDKNKRVGYIGYFKFLGRCYPFRSPGAAKYNMKLFTKE